MLSWGAKGIGATGHRLGTGAFDDDDEDLYMEPRPIRDLVGEEVCQVNPAHFLLLLCTYGKLVISACCLFSKITTRTVLAAMYKHVACFVFCFVLYWVIFSFWFWGRNMYRSGVDAFASRVFPPPYPLVYTSTSMSCHVMSCQVQAGSSHCLAGSMGGDLYVWGRGESGQLGLGDRESKQIPTLNAGFPEGTEVSQVRVATTFAGRSGNGEEVKAKHTFVVEAWRTPYIRHVFQVAHSGNCRLDVCCTNLLVSQALHRGRAFSTDRGIHTFVEGRCCGPPTCLFVTKGVELRTLRFSSSSCRCQNNYSEPVLKLTPALFLLFDPRRAYKQ